MEDFITTYHKDFCWPWDIPVKTNTVWPPLERPIVRPRKCPALPCPECPCPDHTWAARAGHYACLAEKEGGVHRKIQEIRNEIARCQRRTAMTEEKNKSDRPPLLRDDPKRSTYAIDYARKDTVPLTFVELLAEIEATGIPSGPLGRTNYGMYTDPNPIRTSFYTNPLYDPTRPVHRQPYEEITVKYFREYPGNTEYMDKYGTEAERVWKRCQQQKYPAPLLEPKAPAPSSTAVVPY